MMSRFIFLSLLGLILLACQDRRPELTVPSKSAHDLSDELAAIYDISQLPFYLDNTQVAQTSSYDTTGGNDDGFSGRYSFLKRNADSSLVIFQVKGNGVINRIWTPTPNSDTLDFYIGNTAQPTFSVSFMDLFSGKKYPFVGPLCGNQIGGFYCYLPIPFEDGCTIVTRGKKIQFHQIQYRLYQDELPVKSFSLNLTKEEKAALEKVSTLFNQDKRSIKNFISDSSPLSKEEKTLVTLKPDNTKTIFEKKKGGRILGIELDPADVFQGLSQDVDIRITWDDDQVPAVYCPVADFFGFAFGVPSMQSLLIGTKNNHCYSYFPMPFDHTAKVELVNRANVPVDISARIIYSDQQRSSEHEGRFYSYWNSQRPATGKPHLFAGLTGKGHYVGTVLKAQGLKAGMTYFFEGDDSTAIDGTFRMHGTGSEDYFNGGWYALMDRWEGKMSLPLHGALDYSLPFCRTGGYRLFLGDKMTFNEHFYHSIEHGPTKNSFPVAYTSVAYYYADKAPDAAPTPKTSQTKVFIPDTLYLYPQLLDFNFEGDIQTQTTWKYGTGGLSFRFTVNDNSAIRISLKDIPEGTYSLGVDWIEDKTRCDFSIWQRQTQVSDWISASSQEEKRTEKIYIPQLMVGDFRNTLTFHFKTRVDRNTFLLNRIVLIRKS